MSSLTRSHAWPGIALTLGIAMLGFLFITVQVRADDATVSSDATVTAPTDTSTDVSGTTDTTTPPADTTTDQTVTTDSSSATTDVTATDASASDTSVSTDTSTDSASSPQADSGQADTSTSDQTAAAAASLPTPVLTTDQADYFPGSIVTIVGNFFQSLTSFVLNIFGTNTDGSTYTAPPISVTSDSNGSFTTTYTLDDIMRPLYTIVANGLDGTALAQTTFTDPSSPAANLEQCHNNGGGGTYADCADPSHPGNTWGSGNANKHSALLHEGDSQNYRLILTNMAVGTPVTVNISQQYTKGGKMAYDYPTGPGDINTATGGLAGIFPCDNTGLSPCPNGLPSVVEAGKSLLTIPVIGGAVVPNGAVSAETITSQTNYQGTPESTSPTRSPSDMYVYGATPGLFGGYTFTGTSAQVATGDTKLNWSFTITPTSPTVVIAWGAHISKASDYAGKGTAVFIKGSPYHTYLTGWSLGSLGQQDMQMASAAVVPPQGTLAGLKYNDLNGDSSLDNGEPPLSGWTIFLDTNGNGILNNGETSTTTDSNGLFAFPGLPDGAYSICEVVQAGWTQTDPGGPSCISVNLVNGIPDNLNPIAFGNRSSGTIELTKVWSGTGGQTTLNIGTTAGASDIDTQLTGASGSAPLTTGSNVVNAGTYYISETGGLVDYTSSVACLNGQTPVSVGQDGAVIVAGGAQVVCTYTNMRQQGKIQLAKDFVGTPENVTIAIGTSQNGSQTESKALSADGATSEHTVDTGVFFVSETLTTPANYTSSLACYNDLDNSNTVGGGDTSHTVNTSTGEVAVGNGDDVLCVYTNTRNQGSIELKKHWVGTASSVDLAIGTSQGGSQTDSALGLTTDGTTGANTVDTGTYYISEVVTDASNYDSSVSCVNGQTPVFVGNDGSVAVGTNDVVVCTYTNTRHTGTIELKKVWIGGAGSTNLKIGSTTGGTEIANQLVSGADGSTGQKTVDTGTYYANEDAVTGYDTTPLSCFNDANNNGTNDGEASVTVGTSNAVAVTTGQHVICTFTNTKRATLTIVKDAAPNDLIDFSFNGTNGIGAFQLDDDAGVTGGDNTLLATTTFTNLVPQSTTVTETEPNAFWALGSATCVVTGTATPYASSLIGTALTIVLSPGADVTCKFLNNKLGGATRTLGFWQTHTTFTTNVFNGAPLSGSMLIGNGTTHKGPVDTIGKVFGAFYAPIAKTTLGVKRTPIDQARIQLLQQLVAAKLNCAAFGCSGTILGEIATADADYAAGVSKSAILADAGLLGDFNNSGDTIIFSPPLPAPGKATPKVSSGLADKVFWDAP